MREETTARTIEEKVYVCETCGFRSKYKIDVVNCEKKHAASLCAHVNKVYSLISNRIYLNCTACKAELDSEGLTMINPEASQETLKSMFDLIKSSWEDEA